VAGKCLHSATKGFTALLGESLSFELKPEGVDVLSYQPALIATKMLGILETSTKIISPERSAQVCLRDLGCDTMSQGSFRHEFSLWQTRFLWSSMMQASFAR